MPMQGKLVDRDGALHVLYQTTFDGEPIRRSLYWKVVQSIGNPYGHERPAAGDSGSYSGSGRWAVTSRRAGSVGTGDGTYSNELFSDDGWNGAGVLDRHGVRFNVRQTVLPSSWPEPA